MSSSHCLVNIIEDVTEIKICSNQSFKKVHFIKAKKLILLLDTAGLSIPWHTEIPPIPCQTTVLMLCSGQS